MSTEYSSPRTKPSTGLRLPSHVGTVFVLSLTYLLLVLKARTVESDMKRKPRKPAPLTRADKTARQYVEGRPVLPKKPTKHERTYA